VSRRRVPSAYIGLGSNLGDPVAQLSAALAALSQLPETQLAARSSLYRSAPVGDAAQPDFVNAVARVETGLAPETLLDALQEIERAFGRERPFPGAPRTLDLDLLLYGSRRIATARLSVPHPCMHQRAFVLLPLLELDAGIDIPGRGAARACLPAVSGQRIVRLS
jgi:2-amino-4-hydroxy-6-hydroxymethyldihydropteridine diphosphokinase